ASGLRDVMTTSAPARANSPAARIPTGPVPATMRTRWPRTSPAAWTIFSTAATAAVLEPFESSMSETRNGPKNPCCAAPRGRAPRLGQGENGRGAATPPPPGPELPAIAGASALVGSARERVCGGLGARDDRVDPRLALQGPLDRFLHRPVVEVEDLLVVLRLPVDEDAHQDAVVVHLVARDHARRHA